MMRRRIGQALLAGVGMAHLLPAAGALSRERVERLYGVTLTDPDLALLMRHRAAFFGLVGLGLILGSVVPRWLTPTLVAAGVSLLAYVGMATAADNPNEELQRIARVDVALLIALALSALLLRRPEGRFTRSTG